MEETIQEPKPILPRVRRINKTLRDKGFTQDDIHVFWAKFLEFAPEIDKAGIENIKICTGCGTLNIEKIQPPALGCCPDNNYKKIEA